MRDGESWRSILSDKPSVHSPEGLLFIVIGALGFTACVLAVEALDLTPTVSFVAGIVFVIVFEPLREWLAGQVAEREELLEDGGRT